MTKKRLWWAAAVLAVPLLAMAWWLASPLFIDEEVSEDFPMSGRAAVPEGMTREQVEEEMKGAAESPGVTAAEPMPEGEPVALASGVFTDADSFHRGSGTATIYRLSDGSRLLRLENFEVTNGPDLHVLLVPHPAPANRDDVAGYVDLGPLKGNLGDQNYPIPADLDLSGFSSVVVYCVPFHVVFTVAGLTSG